MREELSITKMIVEERILLNEIGNMLNNDFNFITYYQKNRPYCGARKAEDQKAYQEEKLQSLCDKLRRFQAIKAAHTKANRETMVTVPEEPRLENFLKGKEQGTESITIAEAINRKNVYSARSKGRDSVVFPEILRRMKSIYANDFNDRTVIETKMIAEVDKMMSSKFPAESKNSWKLDQYNEERDRLLKEAEIQTIDPKGIIKSDAINKFIDAVNNYLSEIDILVSQANASTIVTVEY